MNKTGIEKLRKLKTRSITCIKSYPNLLLSDYEVGTINFYNSWELYFSNFPKNEYQQHGGFTFRVGGIKWKWIFFGPFILWKMNVDFFRSIYLFKLVELIWMFILRIFQKRGPVGYGVILLFFTALKKLVSRDLCPLF